MHDAIIQTLEQFHSNNKIPNILFYGPSGSGKKTIVSKFIQMIYKSPDDIERYVITVNCAHGKGIKFIREELKFFAKTNINVEKMFKTIILINSDKLTCDAQSAMRRCIELFSFSTRFFIITEDKSKLLKPILSRFSEIYVPLPLIDGNEVNLHQYYLNQLYTFNFNKDDLEGLLLKNAPDKISLVNQLYDEAYTAFDLIDYVDKYEMNTLKKYRIMMLYNKIKRNYRHEKLLMYTLLFHIQSV